jgi:hypothetical protein
MATKLDFEQAIQASFDEATGSMQTKAVSGLVTIPYDNLALTYVPSGDGAGQIQTVVYKQGATTVATLTLTYNSSNKLISVVKS